MLTLRAELTDLTQVSAESQRLHGLLQASVDRELQQPGWLPPGNGHAPTNGNGNGHHNGTTPTQPRNGNGHGQSTNGNHEPWNCTPKQQDLIIKIVDDHRLDKAEVEKLAMDQRYIALLNLLAGGLPKHIKVVSPWTDSMDKAAWLRTFKEQQAEGVVFKLLNAWCQTCHIATLFRSFLFFVQSDVCVSAGTPLKRLF